MSITPDAPTEQVFVLQLYTAGASPHSLQAVANIRRICATHLSGRCQLQVVDIYQQLERAARGGIVAVPTLVKQLPAPRRRVFGSLSDRGRVLSALGLSAGPANSVADTARER